MQIVDAATTMGIIFGCMGVGAFLGPVIFNLFTPPKCAPPPIPHPPLGEHSEHRVEVLVCVRVEQHLGWYTSQK